MLGWLWSRSRSRLALSLALLALLANLLTPARAAATAGKVIAEAGELLHFDDPKLDRAWGGQTLVVAPKRTPSRPTFSPPLTTGAPSDRRAGAARPPPVARTLAQASALPPAGTEAGLGGVAASVRATPSPAVGAGEASATGLPSGGPWPYRPRLKLAYHRFSLGTLGSNGSTSAGSTSGAATASTTGSEGFQSLSLELYPISAILRVGTSTQLGWQSGQVDRSGDYFLAQSFTSGVQFPGRLTPFVEGLAGAGYMRRAQTGASSLPGVYWQVGVEGGIEIYMAGRAYTSVAVGYLHTGNLLVVDQSLTSVKQDSWALKVGLGI